MIVDNLKDIMTMETLILNATILTQFLTFMFSFFNDKVYLQIILEINISILTVGACFLYPDIAVILIICWGLFLTGIILNVCYRAFINWFHDNDSNKKKTNYK